jgi:uncharacterized membrane protein YfcA
MKKLNDKNLSFKTMDINTVLILLSIGLFAGLLSGFVGVGGGIIVVPGLIIFLGFSQHTAQGTSLALLMLPVGVLAVMNYYKAGHISFHAAFVIGIAFILGAFLGSKIAIGIDQNIVKKVFAVFMILVALKFLFGK